MIYVCNAFSLSMLDREAQYRNTLGRITKNARIPRPVSDPRAWLANSWRRRQTIASAVGHADVAAIFSEALGILLPVARINIKLGPDDELLVGQYVGPRLSEGSTELPAGAVIEWWGI